jgi:haloalkane dehalogenase
LLLSSGYEDRESQIAIAKIPIIVIALVVVAEASAQQPPPPPEAVISASFPFESRFVEVEGSNLHYVEEGEGEPILFLHGNPTSSYLWRNVIPYLVPQGRAIALDLIGMGKSDKPDIDYIYDDHLRYVEGFIETLDLRNITFVVHDWGSALGLDYTSRHEERVLGVALMEAMVPPAMPRSFMPPEDSMFDLLRNPETGPKMIYEENFFVERVLPGAVIRKLSDEEMAYYRAPYESPESRKPTLVWPNEVPFADGPERNAIVMSRYGQWMQETNMPFLLLYVSPGAIISPDMAATMVERYRNIESHYLGLGRHFIQEDHPHKIGRAIADWRRRALLSRRN